MDSVEVPVERDTRAITRLAMSHDASHFLLTPTEVARPANVHEVAALIADAAARRRPLTFRAGGTSLTGQAVTDGTLVDVRRHFRHIEVLDDGRRVRAGAGATLADVNARLAPYGRRLGPDPSSGVACTVGGIVANNGVVAAQRRRPEQLPHRRFPRLRPDERPRHRHLGSDGGHDAAP
ncbi:MAG TPA: FAD-dependent oxidoreductase [Arachnia sp.]|nr:FAD-dependent oxidoreductase [Arachnia sp.]